MIARISLRIVVACLVTAGAVAVTTPAQAAPALSSGCAFFKSLETTVLASPGTVTIGSVVMATGEQVAATPSASSPTTTTYDITRPDALHDVFHGQTGQTFRYDVATSGTYSFSFSPDVAISTTWHFTCGYPPTINLSAPASPYAFGQTVHTTFSCSAGTNPVATCVDSNGATSGTGTVDTSSVGGHTYSVISTDTSGLQRIVTFPYTVNQASQTISFTSTAPTTASIGGPAYSVSASATSGLPVAFSIDPASASVCSLAGSSVTFTGAGTCTINANQVGNSDYLAAPQVSQSFTVSKAATNLVAFPTKKGLLGLTASTFVAYLTRVDTGTPISGQTIAFTVGGKAMCTAITHTSGIASCSASIGLLDYLVAKSYTATFAGTATLKPSSGSALLS